MSTYDTFATACKIVGCHINDGMAEFTLCAAVYLGKAFPDEGVYYRKVDNKWHVLIADIDIETVGTISYAFAQAVIAVKGKLDGN